MWTVWLNMSRTDNPGCGYGTSTKPGDRGRETFGDVMAEAFRMATFYLSDRGDGAYDRVDVHAESCCAACGGTGQDGRSRPTRPIKCKACKGKGGRAVILACTWALYDNEGKDFVTCVMHDRSARSDDSSSADGRGAKVAGD